MDIRQHDKAARVRSGWAYELQAISCRTGRGFPGTAGDAKHFTNRAQRRVNSFLVEEGLDDYYGEVQEELDAIFDEWMREAFEDDDRFDEGPELDLDVLFLVFNGNHEFFMDGNHPGVVYYCRQGHVEPCMRAVIGEGGSPYELDRDGAMSFAIEGDDFHGRWYIHSCPEWWYKGGRDVE